MRRVLVLGFVLFPLLAGAQVSEPLLFREKTFDFGEIDETGGNADHEFLFTNNASRPVKILSVSASCGCTTPGWSKDPVAPGKTGFIKASYDPKGRPGFFNKTLTVLTDFDGSPIILQIKGSVVRESTSVDLPVVMGNLRMKSKSFSLGTLYINKAPVIQEFPVMNGSDTPINFLSVQKPAYIQVETPSVLAPRQRGVIKVLYDAKARGVYGFVSDNVLLVTSDPSGESKSISVFATLEEYYSPPTAEELSTAPQAVVKEPSVDLGQYPPGATLERSVTVYNKGKKELKIKALQGNCPCITAEATKLNVRSGDSTQLKIVFKPQTRGGTQQKAVTVYTNDPRNPVQLISVSVYINN